MNVEDKYFIGLFQIEHRLPIGEIYNIVPPGERRGVLVTGRWLIGSCP